MKKIYWGYIILILLSSCGFAIKKKIVGNYYLIATDTGEQLGLSYCDPKDSNGCFGITEGTVYSAGHNENYIVAKQHPNDNRQIINYFILPIKSKRNINGNFGLIGPLNLVEFEIKRRQLNITSIKFDVVYKELE